MVKKVSIILMAFCLILTACGQGGNTVEKASSLVEASSCASSLITDNDAFDFKDDGSLDEQTKEALTFEQDIEPIASEKLSDTENKVIICIKDKDGNPMPGLRISFSGYTGYSIEGQNGQLRVFFPAIGCPPVFTKGKELYAYTDENGEYEWNGSCYTNKTLPERYWLDAGIEIEGVDYFKTSAVYFVDTMKDHGGGAYRYEYLWKYDERPEGK